MEIFKTCDCGQQYMAEAFEVNEVIRCFDRGLCHSCDEQLMQREMRHEEERKKALITKSLIDAFGSHLFETDLSRLDPKLQQIANDYTYSERGVGFIGNSNIGKSRCIFSIVRKLALEGRSFLFLTGPQLAQTLKDTRSDDARDRHDAREMLEDARRMSLLVLDDIAQEKSSGEVLTAFWDLLNARRERKLPLFWTSNVPLAQFRARFEESKAESIITRLRDVSTVYPL